MQQHERVRAAGIDPERLEALWRRARREVDEGLLPAVQLAIAHKGAVVASAVFGAATATSLVSVFSATKALTAATAWRLLEDGRLDETARVADLIPEFGTHGKDVMTVEQLFTHTAGFPHAPFRPLDWLDPDRRRARWQQWRLAWPPGSRYEYHPTASMWVIAELIERVSGRPFGDVVRAEVIEPLGLSNLFLGLPGEANARVLDCMPVGAAATADDYARLGLPEPPVTEVTEEAILNFNRPEIRAVGVPGGGAVATAEDLALFWQALLHGGRAGRRLWSDAWLTRARRVRTGTLTDPVYGVAANRGLGIVIAGDASRTVRGFGHGNSPGAMGHNGAGGQIAWADPASGISFAYVTSGHDRNPIREARRTVALASLAADLTASLTADLAKPGSGQDGFGAVR
ncbi:MAG: beta-lactamase family protein [Pseudomonadales bacterium]|nr:beta-lactamase family protein [Pseudomonadales bacterium]